MLSLDAQSDTRNTDTATHRKLVSRDPRGLRFELRRALVSSYGSDLRTDNKGLIECGAPLMVANGVVVRKSGDSAGYAGVKSCGRASVCPVCAAKVGSHRAGEISEAVTHYRGNGGDVIMLTLTMRHRNGQSLEDLWAALSASWKAATNGRKWRSERQKFKVAGFNRTVETTYGENGWHLHVHALLYFREPVADETVEELSQSMFWRWSSKLQEHGLEAPSFQHGIDWKRASNSYGEDDAAEVLAAYLTKVASGIGFEMAGSTEKKGRRTGSVSPWQIAQLAVAAEDATERKKYMALWLEWLRCSRGKRMHTWSRGLRDEIGLGQELTDEEAAKIELDGDAVAVIPARSWGIMRTRYPELLGDILRLVEGGHSWERLAELVRLRDTRLRIEPAPEPVRQWCRENTVR